MADTTVSTNLYCLIVISPHLKMMWTEMLNMSILSCPLSMSVWLLVSVRITSIVLDLADMLFTPETSEVFCGLKHFAHPTIGIVVST